MCPSGGIFGRKKGADLPPYVQRQIRVIMKYRRKVQLPTFMKKGDSSKATNAVMRSNIPLSRHHDGRGHSSSRRCILTGIVLYLI